MVINMDRKAKKIFLSSTFDESMYSYRKKIRNEVITTMNYFFGQIRGNFYLLDYELGIPDGTPMPEVLLECFDAISNSDIFIGIIGPKYGTVPKKDQIDFDIKNQKLMCLLNKYNAFVKDKDNKEFRCSVLELEFLHAINSSNKKFFYVPSNKDNIENDVNKLIELVKEAGFSCTEYSNEEQLCEIVCNDLKNEIRIEFKSEFSSLNDIEKTFNNFYSDKNRFYVKKEDVENKLSSYLNGTDERPLIIYGPSGSGKSTCLTNWIYQKKLENKYLIIDYWIGLNGENLDDSYIVSDILKKIDYYSEKYRHYTESKFNDENRKLDNFRNAISYLQNDKNNRYIILIDGLNYLIKKNIKNRFWWLPNKLPSNVKMILTTTDENMPFDKSDKSATLPMKYSDIELRSILERILIKHRKAAELKSFQSLLENLTYPINNPLFINVTAREIILTANFSSINNTIKLFKQAQSMIKVFELLLKRLEAEYTIEVVMVFFLSIVLSRYGISIEDIKQIMKLYKLETEKLGNLFSDMYFFLLKRDSDLLISYEALKIAVLNKYLIREKEVRVLILKNSELKKANEYNELEIIYQLYKLNEKDQLSMVLMDFKIALILYKKEEIQFLTYTRYLQEDLTNKIILEWKTILFKEDVGVLYEYGCDLANLIFQLGEHETAKTIYEYIINSINQVAITDGNKYIIARSYNDLASYYISHNKLDDAETNYKKAYELIYSNCEDKDVNLAVFYSSMGMVYKLRKDPAAEQYYKNALMIQLGLYGKTNLDIITTYNGLAEHYIYMGEYKKAKKYNKKAFKIASQILDENHPTYAKIYNSESMISGSLNDKKSEIEFSMKANNILISNLGKYHSSVDISYYNLGNIYYPLKRYRKAIKYYRKSIAIIHTVYGGNHEKLVSRYTNMGVTYEHIKEYRKAENYFKKAISIIVADEQKNQLSIINLLNRVAHTLEVQKKIDEAEKTYIKMLDIIKSIQEFKLENILYIYNRLIIIYHDNNNIKEYNKYVQKFNDIKRELNKCLQ